MLVWLAELAVSMLIVVIEMMVGLAVLAVLLGLSWIVWLTGLAWRATRHSATT